MASLINGFATASGTEGYASRFRGALSSRHFKTYRGLKVSSIGVGTYLGEADDATDRRMEAGIRLALQSGCNVVDTAINYRCQRSERVVGRVLADLIGRGASREGILVSTKGGFIPYDATPPATGEEAVAYFKRTFLDPGFCKAHEVTAGNHCLAPAFLRHQIAASRANLGLDTIDLYFLHNPETQLQEIRRETLMSRLREAFVVLEEAVEAGHIRMYGLATWEALRARPDAEDALNLADIVTLVERIAGKAHHLRAVQLPYNLGMPQAFIEPTQSLGDRTASLLTATQELGMFVTTSVTLMQGQMTQGLPAIVEQAFPECVSDAQRAIQFVRSTPGVHVALVGMTTLAHVKENMAVAAFAPASKESFMTLFVES